MFFYSLAVATMGKMFGTIAQKFYLQGRMKNYLHTWLNWWNGCRIWIGLGHGAYLKGLKKWWMNHYFSIRIQFVWNTQKRQRMRSGKATYWWLWKIIDFYIILASLEFWGPEADLSGKAQSPQVSGKFLINSMGSHRWYLLMPSRLSICNRQKKQSRKRCPFGGWKNPVEAGFRYL